MNIVFAYNSPPPINGSAMVGKAILDSLRISNNHNVIRVIDTKLHVSIDDVGFKSPIRKILVFSKVLKAIRENSYKDAALYLAINLNYFGILKLLIILAFSYKKYKIFYVHNHMMISDENFVVFIVNNLKKIRPILLSNAEAKLFKTGLFLPNRSLIKDLYVKKKHFNAFRLLFMSHFFTWKGLYDLLLFVREVELSGIEIYCKIYGSEGDLKLSDLVLRCQDLEVSTNVTIHAPIYSDVEKAEAFNWANLVFYPSRKDYAPLFLLECSQFGIPVIAYDVGLIPEILENYNAGLVVKSFDEAIMKSVELGNNGQLRALSVNIRKRYCSSLSLGQWHKQINNLFS